MKKTMNSLDEFYTFLVDDNPRSYKEAMNSSYKEAMNSPRCTIMEEGH